jgi:hypothetical protein
VHICWSCNPYILYLYVYSFQATNRSSYRKVPLSSFLTILKLAITRHACSVCHTRPFHCLITVQLPAGVQCATTHAAIGNEFTKREKSMTRKLVEPRNGRLLCTRHVIRHFETSAAGEAFRVKPAKARAPMLLSLPASCFCCGFVLIFITLLPRLYRFHAVELFEFEVPLFLAL